MIKRPGSTTSAGTAVPPAQPSPNEPVATAVVPVTETAVSGIPTAEVLPGVVITATSLPISVLPTFWPTSTPAVTPTPALFVYVVQAGDTIIYTSADAHSHACIDANGEPKRAGYQRDRLSYHQSGQ